MMENIKIISGVSSEKEVKMKKWTGSDAYQPSSVKKGCYASPPKEHIALSREAAAEGMVLLKNEHNLLPLKAGSRIASLRAAV